ISYVLWINVGSYSTWLDPVDGDAGPSLSTMSSEEAYKRGLHTALHPPSFATVALPYVTSVALSARTPQCLTVLLLLYRRSLVIASEPHGDGDRYNPANGGYKQPSLLLHVLSLLRPGPWSTSGFGTANVLAASTGELYPHCSRGCYEDDGGEGGGERNHDCEEVNEFLT
ncbi:hypothetical protein TrRE_jg3145, partial [Triparma retinervis]